MEHKLTTIKIWIDTRKMLRVIAAISDETMVESIHRLALEEFKRLRVKE